MIELLSSDECEWVRRAAAAALGHINHPESVGTLQAGLNDVSPLVRRSAAYALGAMRARASLQTLIAALEDPDPGVRRNAAWGLGRIGDRAALASLQKLFEDDAWDGAVSMEARKACAAIESPFQRLLPGKRGT
jgi:HEAT repeat protein